MTDSVKPEKLYVTLGGEGTATIEEKRSEFIGYAAHVQDETEAQNFVRRIKAKHHDARHNVYAYVLGDTVQRYSDDGEPQGAAGIPVLDVIRKSGVTDACIVVTRYFGGILLGAGGLVRAYTAAAKAALDAAGTLTMERYTELRLHLSYADYQKLSAKLASLGATVDAVDFGSEVTLDVALKATAKERFADAVRELFAGRVPVEVRGERYDAR